MSPIFKNIEVSRDDIGDHMKTYAEERNVMNQPENVCRKYVGGKNHDHFTLAEMVCKTRNTRHQDLPSCRIYSRPEQIRDARRAGDADPNKKIPAENNTLTGNSMYGTTATNKEKGRKIAFCNENNVSRCINDPFCRQCNQLNETTVEVEDNHF